MYRLFFAFGGLGEGRELLKTQFEQTFDPIYSEVPYALAYQVNDDPNNIELRTIAVMKQGELIEALQRGGEFEIQNCHALIVFMYHLWDEYYRPRMADALGLEQSGQLKSDLFGDIRLIRNGIIHNQAVLAESEYNNLKMLSDFEEVSPGELRLTQESVQGDRNGSGVITATCRSTLPPGELIVETGAQRLEDYWDFCLNIGVHGTWRALPRRTVGLPAFRFSVCADMIRVVGG